MPSNESACRKSGRLGMEQVNNCSSHTWNEEDDAVDNQLEKWGVGKVFSDHLEPVKIELRA